MQIVLTADGKAKLPSGAAQSFPKGWTGDVSDAVAVQLIKQGVVAAPVEVAAPLVCTPTEAAVLVAAAQQAIAAVANSDVQAAPIDQVDQATAEAAPIDQAGGKRRKGRR